ncbi:MAG: mechanosensitive ion channel [Muribaculaceae bacterium]|nr:mechanosensitive ion channel [Muribaculaceae bacterium]
MSEIQIFSTIITTGDNKAIIIPNGGLSTGSINNWSREEYRRVEWNIGISYGDNVETARKRILDILASEECVVKTTFADDRAARNSRLKAEKESPVLTADTPSQPSAAQDTRTGNAFTRFFSSKKRAAAAALEAGKADVPSPYALMADTVNREPSVVLGELADSSVSLKIRAWTRSSDYWAVYFTVNERIYNELPQAGISFPFPQLDVHMTTNQPKA